MEKLIILNVVWGIFLVVLFMTFFESSFERWPSAFYFPILIGGHIVIGFHEVLWFNFKKRAFYYICVDCGESIGKRFRIFHWVVCRR